jgi:hypothetical protein
VASASGALITHRSTLLDQRIEMPQQAQQRFRPGHVDLVRRAAAAGATPVAM